MDDEDLIFLDWDIERANDGQRQAHYRLIDLWHMKGSQDYRPQRTFSVSFSAIMRY
jgi:hypothetical protein